MWPISDRLSFYAFRISSGMLNTSAGLRINTNAQVVDDRYKPIAGLYAAGRLHERLGRREVLATVLARQTRAVLRPYRAKHIVKTLTLASWHPVNLLRPREESA